MTLRSRSLVIDLIDLVAKHKSGELRCPATALIPYEPVHDKINNVGTNQV